MPLRRIVHRASTPYRYARVLRKARLRSTYLDPHSPQVGELVNRVWNSRDPNLQNIRSDLIRHADNTRRFRGVNRKGGTSRAYMHELGLFRSAFARWRLAVQPAIHSVALKRAFYSIGLLNTARNRSLRQSLVQLMENYDVENRRLDESRLLSQIDSVLDPRKSRAFLGTFLNTYSTMYSQLSSIDMNAMPFW